MIVLTEDFLRTEIKTPKPLLNGLDASLYIWYGKYKARKRPEDRFLQSAAEIDKLSPFWRSLGNDELKAKLAELKSIFRRQNPDCESVLPQAMAAIREAARRTIEYNPEPYIEQIAGALSLNKKYILEMATGEGKSLTAALTAVLWGWIGKPCHIITVNDYLADRDSKWHSPLFKLCGVTTGAVTGEMQHKERKEGYHHDITYTTSKEIVADFLRDRLILGPFQKVNRRQIRKILGALGASELSLVMRGIHSAIVDEADSILIDEAVTPLIISKPQSNEPFVEACRIANELSKLLQTDTDYRIDVKYKEIELLPECDKHLAEASPQIPRMYQGMGHRKELIRQALTAKEFFNRDSQYVLQDGKVVIVDEFTGRLMPQRTWRSGLHQLIEAKEGMPITPPSETLARLSFQRFFRFFHKLAGMTGTAREAASEFWHIYGLQVVTIPTHAQCRRIDLPRKIFLTSEAKWDAIIDEITAVHATGRPVLVGTRSVKASEELSARLMEKSYPHRVLNAIRHQEEARIIAHAGERGTITVSTNMAGRGTDIKLSDGVSELGGLHVIGTECHESGRIDRQLFGRCARQGDKGTARSFVSMDDELVVRYVPGILRRSVENMIGKSGTNAQWFAEQTVKRAQSAAQKLAYRRRRSVLKMDTWLDDSLSFAQGEVS